MSGFFSKAHIDFWKGEEIMNIIVIVSDTFRYDNLCETSIVKTPALKNFASKSIVFDKCYTSSFPTIPHRTDVMGGKFTFPWHGWKPLDPELPVLSTVLKEKGYGSQIILDTPHMMSGRAYFNRGFDGAKWIRGQEIDWDMTKFNYQMENILPDEKTRPTKIKGYNMNTASASQWHNKNWIWEEDRFCAQTARAASKWLELNYKKDPFFLWVDMFDPHEPWDPPDYLVKNYSPEYNGMPIFHPNYGYASDYDEDELNNLKAHYYGETQLVDKWIGHILKKVEEIGLMEETMIIFTSDHGMYLGEHDRTGKSNISHNDNRNWPLYKEIIHVPLIIFHPDIAETDEVSTNRVEEIVQPVDIFATIMEEAEVKSIPENHGISLKPFLKGKSKKIREYAFTSTDISNGEGKPVVTGREWSYIIKGEDNRPELYNIMKDPEQKNNVIKNNKKQAIKMHEALLEWLNEIEAPRNSIKYIRSLKPKI